MISLGCSSSYIPQTRGRVGVVMQNGAFAYVRDGQIYPHGLFGGGLVNAVAGNPNAERAAKEYNGRLKTGLAVAIGGLLCASIATSLAVRRIEESRSGRSTELWAALGCAIVSLGGTGYLISAEPYRWDAINVFNDTEPMPLSPPGLRMHAAAPQRSLRMRD